jgi:hypothetical protein
VLPERLNERATNIAWKSPLRRQIDDSRRLSIKDRCEEPIESLRKDGWRFSVFCYWLSKTGEGGPTLSLPQLSKLTRFNLEVGFDCYFLCGPDANEEETCREDWEWNLGFRFPSPAKRSGYGKR